MPYFYLYDSYLQDRSYAATLIKLETTLTDLGIQGRVGRLTLLKSVKDLVETAIHGGADTIVAVGNDITLSQTAQAVIKHQRITVGFIPLGTQNQIIAPLLGIPTGILACHVLSGRLIEELPVGKINNHYWLQSIITQGLPIMECEKSYEVVVESPHTLKICNLDNYQGVGVKKLNNKMTALLTPTQQSGLGWFKNNSNATSSLPFKELKLTSPEEELSLLVDNYRIIKTPATVSIAPQKLRIIVGKKRLI